MIVNVPSILIAAFIYNLGAILEFCGIFYLVLSGISIPAVSLAAQHLIPEKCDFDFKYNYLAGLVLLISSTVVLIACLIATTYQYLS
jgi:predicted Co/Zn/Cd cation transporter (cation efflux family)